REVFARNLPRYFAGRQSIGMSLTGGLDTRMILAWRNGEPGSLACYTFGSPIRENHDVRTARRVAQACAQPFQVIPIGREFLARFPDYAERAVYLTDGCVDVSRAPDLYLNERAREIAPVRMTGNYGGEILRAVRVFKPEQLPSGLFSPEILRLVDQAKKTYSEVAKGHPVTFAAFKQGPWHHQGILSLEQTQLSMRSPFLDNDFVRTVFRSPAAAFSSNGVSLRLVKDGNPGLFRIATDRGLAGNRGRVFGAAGRGFREFQFKAEYAYDMGMPHWLAQLDHTFSGLRLERLFLGRHKVFHFRVWYRDALANYVREILLDSRSLSRPYIDPSALQNVVLRHTKGDRNFTNEIHRLLTLELIHRAFVEKQSYAGAQTIRTHERAHSR
ncbi:MAG: asparagine synthase-related protein, partial [Candidatus Acidiferrales bacterium]